VKLPSSAYVKNGRDELLLVERGNIVVKALCSSRKVAGSRLDKVN
jgi:hypothetical protein